MHFYKNPRASIASIPALLLLVALLVPAPAFCLDAEESQIFISGFHAYQRKDYNSAINEMTSLLKKYPDTPIKDMATFWLARSYYKAGNKEQAGHYMARFFREYPDSPLKATVEEGLAKLALDYQKAEGAAAAPAGAASASVAREGAAVPTPPTVPRTTSTEETRKPAAEKAAAGSAR